MHHQFVSYLSFELITSEQSLQFIHHLYKGNRWKLTEGSEYIIYYYTEVQLVSPIP